MAFNLINDFRTSFYHLDDNGFEFRFQPVVPFRAWKTSNILRVVVPYQVDGPGDEGLKDVTSKRHFATASRCRSETRSWATRTLPRPGARQRVGWSVGRL